MWIRAIVAVFGVVVGLGAAQAATYRLTFNPTRGTLDPSQMEKRVSYGQTVGTLPMPGLYVSGIRFDGWYTAPEGGTRVTESTVMSVRYDVTLYAQWEPVLGPDWKRVTFNANGGSCGTTKIYAEIGSPVGDLPWATRTGYQFLGWYTSPYGGTRVTPSTRMVAYEVTLYAQWQYLEPGSSPQNALKGPSPTWSIGSLPVDLVPMPGEPGYYCKYYEFNLQGGQVYTFAIPRSVAHMVDFWTCASDTVEDANYEYHIIDLSASQESFGVEVSFQSSGWASFMLYYCLGDRSPTGTSYKPEKLPGSYVGAAWQAKADRRLMNGEYCFVVDARPGQTYAFSTRLYPRADNRGCETSVDVTGKSKGLRFLYATGGCVAFTVDAPQTATIRVSSNDSNGTFLADAVWTARILSDYEIRQQFLGTSLLRHEIHFNANGGTCAAGPLLLAEGETVGERLPTASRPGYGFLGWYTSASGGVRVTPDVKMVGYDVTLVAHWQEIVRGSCESDPLAGPAPTSFVQSVPVELVPEWNEASGQFYDGWYARYGRFTLKAGWNYTFAVRRTGDVELDLWTEGYEDYGLERAEDANYVYVYIDRRRARHDEDFILCVSADNKRVVDLLFVRGNSMPTGAMVNPEALPGTLDGEAWSAYGVRNLLGGRYSFCLEAQPGIRYRLVGSGYPGLMVQIEGVDDYSDINGSSIDIPDEDSRVGAVSFTVDQKRRVRITFFVGSVSSAPILVDVDWSRE